MIYGILEFSKKTLLKVITFLMDIKVFSTSLHFKATRISWSFENYCANPLSHK